MSSLPYRDPGLSIEVRTADLLGRMSREEKLAQIVAVWAADGLDGVEIDLTTARARIPNGAGECRIRPRERDLRATIGACTSMRSPSSRMNGTPGARTRPSSS